MIHVLHAIDTAGPGGAETVFMTLAQRLDPERYRSSVAVAGRGWLYDELRRQGMEPFVVGGQRGFDVVYLYRLVRLIRRQRIDIVQSHLFGSNLYCCLAGALTGVPVISTFHGGVDIGPYSRLRATKLKMVDRLSASIVAVSDSLANELCTVSHLSRHKLATIYNGVDTDRYAPRSDTSVREQLGLDSSHLLVGAVGNIRPAKSYDIFIQAAAILARQSPRYKFVIVGQGDNALHQQLLTQCATAGLDGRLFFLGFQNDVPRFLNNLDVFMLSSNSEGFSIATIEAMACGLPVVATRSGGPEEIITHEMDGLLVDRNDSRKLAAAVHRLGDDPALRMEIGRRARSTAAARFSIERMTAAYQILYELHGSR